MRVIAKYLVIVANGTSAVIWLVQVGWVALVTANWTMTPVSGAIQQCVLASQSAALAIIGYAVARGLTEAIKLVVKTVEALGICDKYSQLPED
jgi:hypothetical protein